MQMANRAPKPCSHHPCGKLVAVKYCETHAAQAEAKAQALRAQFDRQRGSAHQRGYSAKWQQARAGYLRSHPLCLAHEARGQVVAATVVDHKVPHKGDKALFWDNNNWQALCKRCHDTKTAREDGGFGRATTDSKSASAPPQKIFGSFV